MLIDIHQHLWTAELIEALETRAAPPMVRREGGLITLYSDTEVPFLVDLGAETPERRAALVRSDGLDRALIAISSPIGVELLPREQAQTLIAKHLDGVLALPPEFAAWGPLVIDGAEPGDVDWLLERGCVGISISAGAIVGQAKLERLGPVLERVAERGVPLFIHPGVTSDRWPAYSCTYEPLWWKPLTDYVSQMQAAWFTFAAWGRRDHPDLRVVFAMLAGGALLQTERLAVRGGPTVDVSDANSFYETSSYGRVAVEMTAGIVGPSQLLYGSDRPVIDPVSTGHDRAFQENSAELFAVVNV